MHVFGIVNLLHEASQDLPVFLQSLWHPCGDVSQEAVQMHTAGARKCRLTQSDLLGVV